MTEAWTYREGVAADPDLSLIGYDVEAVDGKIGVVDEESNVDGDSFIVVETGFWIMGQKVLLPAALVTQITPQEKKIYVAQTQDEIKESPEFAEETYRDPGYRHQVAEYYATLPRPV
jgi:hypothetical protein